MSARPKFAVHFFIEGDGFVVRGTEDPHEALALAVGEEDEFDDRYDHLLGLGCVRPRPDLHDPEPTPEGIAALADQCHEWIREARPGLYRMNVANDADGYVSWWLGRPSRPGPGVWRGVMFR